MIHVDFSMFVDRPGVMKRVERKRLRVLARTGGFARQAMKRQMRPAGKKGKSSRPGEPPRTIVGTIRDLILFGVDGEEVVIGPKLNKTTKGNRLLGKASVPQLLNEGGRESLLYPNGQRETVSYEPRPFVDPIRPTVEQFFEKAIEETPL